MRRNLGHIERLLTHWTEGRKLPLLGDVSNKKQCDNRIVSVSQPYVGSIIRDKQNKTVEFGLKPSVSLTDDGFSQVDPSCWNAFHEGLDLKSQVETYKARTGESRTKSRLFARYPHRRKVWSGEK